MKVVDPTQGKAWKNLESLAQQVAPKIELSAFRDDAKRARSYQKTSKDLLFNYARNLVDDRILDALLELAEESSLHSGIEALFNGEKINGTENRAVLHTALRRSDRSGVRVDSVDVLPEVHEVLDRMKAFSTALLDGSHTGFSGKPITDVVNIGIGGSDLGPLMAYEALKEFGPGRIKAHYVSNVDGIHLHRCLAELDPETTLFIVASKTFTTQETMSNAGAAREWFLQAAEASAVQHHFVAISTNLEAVAEFGISEELTFGFWNWVGGRYSMWSAIGLSLCCSLGYDVFEQMLRGAEHTDEHFRSSEPSENIPVLMALIGIWYNNFLGWSSHAILPYDQRLHRFPAYLQQADMESNGKYVDRTGKKIGHQSGPIIWGEPGTNGQHAFYQLLHQGTKNISCDFIAGARSRHPYDEQQEILLANFFAQPQALMNGLDEKEVRSNMEREGIETDITEQLLPHRIFEGNRPSNIFFYKELTPFVLGQLVALYEHKIFCQGWIWNIFSFDQWGVELGKKVAKGILSEMKELAPGAASDAVTQELLRHWEGWK
jgi:glucose-6-phosphate isomerase